MVIFGHHVCQPGSKSNYTILDSEQKFKYFESGPNPIAKDYFVDEAGLMVSPEFPLDTLNTQGLALLRF